MHLAYVVWKADATGLKNRPEKACSIASKIRWARKAASLHYKLLAFPVERITFRKWTSKLNTWTIKIGNKATIESALVFVVFWII